MIKHGPKFKRKMNTWCLKMICFPSETLIRKRKILRPFLAPIQIASDFEKLIVQPEQLEFFFFLAKRISKEPWRAIQKLVESSAKREFLNSFSSIGIPLILWFWSMGIAIVSVINKNKHSEIWKYPFIHINRFCLKKKHHYLKYNFQE